MGWTECIGEAIEYIEANIMNELTVDAIAKHVALSPYYFQRGFNMLCGVTVGEYIRRRANLRKAWMTKTITVRFGYP